MNCETADPAPPHAVGQGVADPRRRAATQYWPRGRTALEKEVGRILMLHADHKQNSRPRRSYSPARTKLFSLAERRSMNRLDHCLRFDTEQIEAG
jgi:hypothetical protein